MADIIKTEFMSFDEGLKLAKLFDEHKVPDNVQSYVFNELQRLQSIIRDYELGMLQVVGKLESKTFKKPKLL